MFKTVDGLRSSALKKWSGCNRKLLCTVSMSYEPRQTRRVVRCYETPVSSGRCRQHESALLWSTTSCSWSSLSPSTWPSNEDELTVYGDCDAVKLTRLLQVYTVQVVDQLRIFKNIICKVYGPTVKFDATLRAVAIVLGLMRQSVFFESERWPCALFHALAKQYCQYKAMVEEIVFKFVKQWEKYDDCHLSNQCRFFYNPQIRNGVFCRQWLTG